MIKLRQMRGRLNGLSKVILSSALLLFITVACEDDESGQNSVGDVLYIDGPAGVSPNSTHEFYHGDFASDVSWSATGEASLTDAAGIEAYITAKSNALIESGDLESGEKWVLPSNGVLIDFNATGTGTVSASGSGLEGVRTITINGVEIGLEVGYKNSSSIKEDGVDDITLSFSAPLAAIPELVLNGAVAGDTSVINIVDNMGQAPYYKGTLTSLSEVEGSNMMKFIATYTATGASETSGQLEAYVNNVEVAADYGGATAERMYILGHTVDNVKPLAKFENPDEVTVVNKGGSVKFMVSASEAIKAVMDSMKLALDYDAGSAGADTLLLLSQSEDDASVWYTNWTNTADGDGSFTATLDQSTVIDLASNDALWDPTTSMFNVTVDNTAPTAFTLTATEDDAVNEPRVINVVVDPGVGEVETTVHWIWLPYNSQFTPESPADFDGEGADNTKFVADAGNFKLFYLAVDAAGNYAVNEDGTAAIKRYPELTGDQEEGDKEASIEVK